MKKVLLLFSLVLLLTACRKSPNFDQLSLNFIVSTSLDKTADFSSYKTFYIADTVKYIGGVGADSNLVGSDADQLVNPIKDSLISRGYAFTSRDNMPDLGLTLTAIKDINVVINYYPGWWDPWWGGCYWYYWCYPYYYPWPTVYSYTTGTLILNMYDLKNASKNQQLTGIWNVTGLGALSASSTPNIQLGVDAINQGFAQSPYVKTH